eukprot:TRINITY_DN7114_c0_g1_i1.p1 TRINITY_DN7114_c0_g1~~TRINITY_DN7114_c0_g1_i1.p1  ORF type:complete len:116 (-),score=6.77 TRINITY_DN7114_c0_g1_i1:268-567(-)
MRRTFFLYRLDNEHKLVVFFHDNSELLARQYEDPQVWAQSGQPWANNVGLFHVFEILLQALHIRRFEQNYQFWLFLIAIFTDHRLMVALTPIEASCSTW